MSTKSTIFLTEDNEHCYVEHSGHDDSIIMEFSKKNIEVILNDNDDLIIEIKKGSELWKIITSIKQ